MYVVIGTNPIIDTSVCVGPFRRVGLAFDASQELDALGYVTEICEAEKVADVVARGSLDWSDPHPDDEDPPAAYAEGDDDA